MLDNNSLSLIANYLNDINTIINFRLINTNYTDIAYHHCNYTLKRSNDISSSSNRSRIYKSIDILKKVKFRAYVLANVLDFMKLKKSINDVRYKFLIQYSDRIQKMIVSQYTQLNYSIDFANFNFQNLKCLLFQDDFIRSRCNLININNLKIYKKNQFFTAPEIFFLTIIIYG